MSYMLKFFFFFFFEILDVEVLITLFNAFLYVELFTLQI